MLDEYSNVFTKNKTINHDKNIIIYDNYLEKPLDVEKKACCVHDNIAGEAKKIYTYGKHIKQVIKLSAACPPIPEYNPLVLSLKDEINVDDKLVKHHQEKLDNNIDEHQQRQQYQQYQQLLSDTEYDNKHKRTYMHILNISVVVITSIILVYKLTPYI